jgi:glycosyltransferase involved in cell wall biosynthesis
VKLIVQIPCLNEEATLPIVLKSIPKKIKNVDQIETLIIDDGSTDRTLEVARQYGVNHIVRHKKNKGLAYSFSDGIDAALQLGADIIVNTDADNQYPQKDIPRLIQPILAGTHDIVVADRQTDKIAHFSLTKKILQKFGSSVVRAASGTEIPDAPSGFRAYSKEAAMSMNIVTDFSYVIETIVQAGKKRIPITHVPVVTNAKTRESRLFKNIGQHIKKSGVALIRSYAMHEPFKVFFASGSIIFGVGLIPWITFAVLSLVARSPMSGHLQSLIFGGVFMMLGFMLGIIGLIADLLAINRKLIEDTLYRIKKIEYDYIPDNRAVN